MGPALFPGIFPGGPAVFHRVPSALSSLLRNAPHKVIVGAERERHCLSRIFFGGRPFRRFEERDGCAALIFIAQQDRAFAALAAFELGLSDEPPR
jgi:hypothetical protein